MFNANKLDAIFLRDELRMYFKAAKLPLGLLPYCTGTAPRNWKGSFNSKYFKCKLKAS